MFLYDCQKSAVRYSKNSQLRKVPSDGISRCACAAVFSGICVPRNATRWHFSNSTILSSFDGTFGQAFENTIWMLFRWHFVSIHPPRCLEANSQTSRLGREFDVPTPVNSALQGIAQRMMRERLKLGSFIRTAKGPYCGSIPGRSKVTTSVSNVTTSFFSCDNLGL